MPLAEEEAMQKWARLRMGLQPKGLVTNRDEAGSPTSNASCAGSGCMAWRWKLSTAQRLARKKPTHGFCGQYGDPESLS
jgi:hypothetical protein